MSDNGPEFLAKSSKSTKQNKKGKSAKSTKKSATKGGQGNGCRVAKSPGPSGRGAPAPKSEATAGNQFGAASTVDCGDVCGDAVCLPPSMEVEGDPAENLKLSMEAWKKFSVH